VTTDVDIVINSRRTPLGGGVDGLPQIGLKNMVIGFFLKKRWLAGVLTLLDVLRAKRVTVVLVTLE
jgi:hypothetical protein